MTNLITKKVIEILFKKLCTIEEFQGVTITSETEDLPNSCIKVIVNSSTCEAINWYLIQNFTNIEIYFIDENKIRKNKVRDILTQIFSHGFDVDDTFILVSDIEYDKDDDMLYCVLNIEYFTNIDEDETDNHELMEELHITEVIN